MFVALKTLSVEGTNSVKVKKKNQNFLSSTTHFFAQYITLEVKLLLEKHEEFYIYRYSFRLYYLNGHFTWRPICILGPISSGITKCLLEKKMFRQKTVQNRAYTIYIHNIFFCVLYDCRYNGIKVLLCMYIQNTGYWKSKVIFAKIVHRAMWKKMKFMLVFRIRWNRMCTHGLLL
jgi:hypothetical protein